jgi:hypothetical protein
MNKDLLRKHIKSFVVASEEQSKEFSQEFRERFDLVGHYKSFTKDRIHSMNEEDIYEYLSQLWAMLIWGNKHYVVDKIIDDNGLDNFRANLSDLVWGTSSISIRWDSFRRQIKGMGPAMISEILCKTHPNDFMLWNRRAYVALNYLGVENLPRYDYQLTGKVYEHLCNVSKEISDEMATLGIKDTTLLAVDYFIWKELQVEDNLSKIYTKKKKVEKVTELVSPSELEYIHDDIRDKLRDIGQWLGFTSSIEQKVYEGSRVDVIWEATIGNNMGRVIYVFEVQTKGSLDSLLMNLLKTLQNPSVQGVLAVSDQQQIEKIRKQASGVPSLRDRLKYWDYEEVLKVHESLEFVYESINSLGLVPQGF